MPLPRKMGHQRGCGEPRQSHVDMSHPWHGSRGGDYWSSRLPTPRAFFRPCGACGRCFHHWGATAQRSGGLVPRHQGTDLPLHQLAHCELGGEGVGSGATQGWRAPSLGGAAELTLGMVQLEEPDFAAAQAKAPPVPLMLPKEHATLLVPNESGVLEPHVPSMRALR